MTDGRSTPRTDGAAAVHAPVLSCRGNHRPSPTDHPLVRERRDQADRRRHAPGQLRGRPPVRPRAVLDPVPAHPRRARAARGRGGGGRRCVVLAVDRGAVPLAGLGGARRREAGRADRRRDGRLPGLRQPRPAPPPAWAEGSAGGVAAAEGDQPGRVRGRQDQRGHRAEPARHPGPRPRDPPRGRGPDPRVHAQPGLRGPAAQDGREEQRRRAVLHAARGHPGDGPGSGPEGRRDGLRPGLRDRRLPRAGVRPHAHATGPGRDGG